MAVRVPIPAGTGIGDRKVATVRVRSEWPASLRASSAGAGGVKQRSFSPAMERSAFATHLGLEMTMLELERLYNALDPALRRAEPGSPVGFGTSGRPVRVAYQGIRGSYCQEAAMSAFATCDAFPCFQMEDAFQALLEKTADRAVIPFENSVDGVIYRNLDLLLRHSVSIVSEILVPVNHCLLATPGASFSSLRRVASQPQALSHCRSRIEELGLEAEEVSNSAEAARFLSENPISSTAVIGSKVAAKEFGLQILEQNFQDRNESNVTRFFQLSLDPVLPSPGTPGVRKTTIAFSLENGVSDLFRALWPFESRSIPVTSVQHRPNRNNPIRMVENGSEMVRYFDYIFIVDLQGCSSDRAVEGALEQLREITGFLRVLGTYASH